MSDATPANAVPETTTPTPAAPATSTPAPADTVQTPQTTEVAHDDGDLDLLADGSDGADTGEPAGEEAPETGIKPIGPGKDATDEELDAWRAEHGVPDDPSGYEAPEVEGFTWNAETLSPIQEIAHRHNVPQAAMAEALAEYARQIQTRQAEIAQRNRANSKAVRSEFSEAEIASIKEAAKAMPPELRRMLDTAILPDGTRLAHRPEVLRLIAAGYGTRNGYAPPLRDHRAMLREELNAIDELMVKDISEYHRPWRATGVSASDRKLQIMRQLSDDAPARPSASEIEAEKREILKLRDADFDMFRFGDWRGSGRPASDRLVAIQSGRG